MKDYDVDVKATLHIEFPTDEINTLMYDRLQRQIAENVKSAFEEDELLSGHVDGELQFLFLDGQRVRLQYTFSCHDGNPEEAESFARYSLDRIGEKLGEQGYRLGKIRCKAEEADMEWLNRLEDMIWGMR